MDDKRRRALLDEQRRKVNTLRKETDIIVRNMVEAIQKADKYKEEGDEAGIKRMRKIAKDYKKRLTQIKREMEVALRLGRKYKD